MIAVHDGMGRMRNLSEQWKLEWIFFCSELNRENCEFKISPHSREEIQISIKRLGDIFRVLLLDFQFSSHFKFHFLPIYITMNRQTNKLEIFKIRCRCCWAPCDDCPLSVITRILFSLRCKHVDQINFEMKISVFLFPTWKRNQWK